ncbi:hypothetical protein E7Z54_06165 [Nocardioides sp.]|nr:hypothetical protein E7Z54_06165 [Nocardioides sp.]
MKVIRDAAGATIGTVLGIAPHVLHHVSLLAGAAVITGASGNVLFYVLGLVLMAPMLRRIQRRFVTPWAPTIAVAVFTGMFALSAFVIGPAISGADDPEPAVPTDPSPTGPGPPEPSPSDPRIDHFSHH